ncbi:hypothetical protein R3I94_013225 [Phoxinus phoxinus]
MKLIFGLMLLLKTAACLEFNCSFLQSGPCNAVLGEKLSLQLVDTREYYLKIQKSIRIIDTDPVCKIRNDRIVNKAECDLFNNRHDEVSVNNGILIINSVIRADSGNYRLEITESEGKVTYRDLQVIIEGVDPLVISLVLGCLAVVLIILVIVAYHFYKKKNRLKPTANVSGNVNEQKKLNRDEEQKRPDVEYATVNSQNQKKKKKKKRRREEEEVHYGEVTFTSASAQRPPQTREDCVYSEVHTR